jgi:hypothetical protein
MESSVPQPPTAPIMRSRGRTFRSQAPVELGDVSGLKDVVPQPPKSTPAPETEAKPPEERYNDRVGRARAANRANVMSRSGSSAEFEHYGTGSPALMRPGDAELSRPGSVRVSAPTSLVASSAARIQSDLLSRAMEAEVERTDCREMVRDITHAVLPGRPGSAAVRLGLGANEAYLNVPDASRHTGGAYLHSSAAAGKASSMGVRLSGAGVAEEQARRGAEAAERATHTARLAEAIGTGDGQLATLLLKQRADPNQLLESRQSPLCAAVQRGHLSLVSALLAHGANTHTLDLLGARAIAPPSRPSRPRPHPRLPPTLSLL